jgi:SAM-dependent methyltransferase
LRPATEKLLRAILRASSRLVGSDELVEFEPGVTVRRFVLEWSRSGPEEARRILDRLPAVVELEGRSVLTLGRGAGDLEIEVARRGARRVVAVDMAGDRLKLTRARLDRDEAELPVKALGYAGDLAVLSGERFEVVLAIDAFRQYGAAPPSRHVEARVQDMAAHVADGGLLAVAFGPPWKSPYGGGTDSRPPWIHLVVPEPILFEEFRRARPGNRARTFDDVRINRITLARFRQAMRDSGLDPVHLATNVGESPQMALLRLLARLPPLEEYVTQNAYGVWRRRAS